MKLYIRLGLVILSCAVLTACNDQRSPKLNPKLNPDPKYFLTAKGRIDPGLMDKVRLTWEVDYQATNSNNPKCQVVTNKFEGVINQKEVDITYLVKPNSKGFYEFKIPLDKYKPGVCGWKIWRAGYQFKYNKQSYSDGYPSVEFGRYDPFSSAGYPATQYGVYTAAEKSMLKHSQVESWRCSSTDCKGRLLKAFNDTGANLKINNNYEFHLNIGRKE